MPRNPKIPTPAAGPGHNSCAGHLGPRFVSKSGRVAPFVSSGVIFIENERIKFAGGFSDAALRCLLCGAGGICSRG
jgi:hypothetical protein